MLAIRMRILLCLGCWREFGLGFVHKACFVNKPGITILVLHGWNKIPALIYLGLNTAAGKLRHVQYMNRPKQGCKIVLEKAELGFPRIIKIKN
jgi:hypothetical protein